jgi:hypothetical protein
MPGRPHPAKWSSLEYACHVRDVYRIFGQRIATMLEVHDPLYANWDQDASATDERYDAQEPGAVVGELCSNAERLAHRLDGVAAGEWERKGRRSDGAAFTIDTIARYMIHDPIHHLWDVTAMA